MDSCYLDNIRKLAECLLGNVTSILNNRTLHRLNRLQFLHNLFLMLPNLLLLPRIHLLPFLFKGSRWLQWCWWQRYFGDFMMVTDLYILSEIRLKTNPKISSGMVWPTDFSSLEPVNERPLGLQRFSSLNYWNTVWFVCTCSQRFIWYIFGRGSISGRQSSAEKFISLFLFLELKNIRAECHISVN